MLAAFHLYPALTMESMWFWLFIAILFVMVTALTEYERFNWAFCVVVFACVGLQLFSNSDIIGVIWKHPLLALGLTTAYFVGGVVWSIAKWSMFCSTQRSYYDEYKESWLAGKKVFDRTVPDHLSSEWKSHLHQSHMPNLNMTVTEIMAGRGPQFRHHKTRCLFWASYWPCSLIWTILNDPMRRLFVYAINSLRGIYEDVARSSFRSTLKDFAGSEEQDKEV